jgi:alpha-D-ribose 1-methylphosphonate 5-triphosphate diphosphatase
LASDYVPSSLVDAAFRAVTHAGIKLHEAVALMSDAPARMANFTDRGRIEVGLRADLVRVRMHDGAPVVRQVWKFGERVV